LGGADSANKNRSSEDFGEPVVRLALDRLGRHLLIVRSKNLRHPIPVPGVAAGPAAMSSWHSRGLAFGVAGLVRSTNP
jgi:hypothetical protein